MAFDLSEKFDTPVFIRLSTRVSHSQSMVEICDREEVELKPYEKNIAKYVMMPGNAKKRHPIVEERTSKLTEYADSYIESESELDRIVNNINSLIDISVYYDGTSAKQASIEMEPMVYDDNYYGDSYWIEPVIVFNDGSRYLIEEYFSSSDFDGVVNNMESFVERYERLLDRYFDFIF